MINQYSFKYSSCILLKYRCFSPHYLRALIHLSHLGTILKILSDCKAGCCIRNHSRAATSTASHLWNQQRRKYCFMYPNFCVFIWSHIQITHLRTLFLKALFYATRRKCAEVVLCRAFLCTCNFSTSLEFRQ